MAMFGARGAVWAYNRVADAVMHIALVYLAIMAVHYVDDTGAETRARSDRPSPNDAERFAGKINFYNTAAFGYLGGAAQDHSIPAPTQTAAPGERP